MENIDKVQKGLVAPPYTDPVKLMFEFFIFAFVFVFVFKLATIPAEISVDNIDFTRLVDKESLF